MSNIKCKLEIYTKNTIDFYMPASSFEQFQLTTIDRGYMKPAEHKPKEVETNSYTVQQELKKE